MQSTDNVKPEPKTELALFRLQQDFKRDDLIIRLGLGKRIEVKQV